MDDVRGGEAVGAGYDDGLGGGGGHFGAVVVVVARGEIGWYLGIELKLKGLRLD